MIRPVYYYLLIFSVISLATSFILQFGFHLEPCSLCIIDRILVFILTLFFLIALWHNPKKLGQQIYSVLGFTIAFAGIILTARHLWLIHLPRELVPACGPSFNYLIETLSPKEALIVILKGSGECAENNSLFWGLSLPFWTMVVFIIMAIGSLVPWWKNRK